MKKAIIYGRVSTNKQDYDRQINDLKKYALVNDYEIVQIFTDVQSGKSKAKDRAAAKAMFDFLSKSKIDIVLVSEISRLGRSTIDVQSTINEIVFERNINMYIDQQGMTAYTKQGKLNTTFKLITDVLANVAEMEREQIRERILSGLANAKRKGIKLGRRKGTTKSDEAILSQYSNVVKELKKETPLSLRKIAKLCDVSLNTVQKVKKAI